MNDIIINPTDEHKYTIILLHGMYSNPNDLLYVSNILKNSFNFLKIILVHSPIIDINWPEGKECNVNSWYNYYTRNDNLMIHDNINKIQFKEQYLRIDKIIKNENCLIGNNVILGGYSQGGTLVYDIVFNSNNLIKAGFIFHSVFMDNIIRINNIKNIETPIFIVSGKKDNIYNFKLQEQMINLLKSKNARIYWKILNNIGHCEYSNDEEIFFKKSLQLIFNT